VRKLQRFCASLSLALALSIPTLAGDIQTGSPVKTSPPPPPPPQSLVYETSEGDTSSTTGAISEVNDATSVDPLAELALALLNGVLSIF
jgi:hypothetical protein